MTPYIVPETWHACMYTLHLILSMWVESRQTGHVTQKVPGADLVFMPKEPRADLAWDTVSVLHGSFRVQRWHLENKFNRTDKPKPSVLSNGA